MNRSIVYLGVALSVSGLGLLLSPWLVTGVESIDVELEVGLVILPLGLGVTVWGGLSPDPETTTVRGVFGNPEENLLQRRMPLPAPVGPARYRPSPRESVNCRYCYTAVPAQVLSCPRCGRRRECIVCHKPLFVLAGAVRCAPCVRDEVYCNCPVVRRPPVSRGSSVRRL